MEEILKRKIGKKRVSFMQNIETSQVLVFTISNEIYFPILESL